MGLGTIVLVGGGEFGSRASFEATFATEAGGELLLVPTAAAFERPERAVERAQSVLGAAGVRVVELPLYERAQAFDPVLADMVRTARCLYLIGGSPFHLRGVLRATPILDALRATLDQGATVLASSAGAMVIGDPMVDPRGGALTVGLGMIPGLAVIPHADTWPRDLRSRTVRLAPPNVTVAEIDEETGLVVRGDGTLERVGVGTVRLLRQGHELAFDDVTLPLSDATTA
ncbi:peptidase S51 dipeptidase E [Acidimicrobium ferrooxidans DSM 10331]|uniref:Peptidase S51 dipeptidase E n=1 Tax=Acidimicrobium ferrooxidans (strain DSM 10331 / JCM 15462 / NBRC 103882 / ICP) TaxID=525909 RepID=C7M292_ACIFD|nr:Type 1 glutamine amidotransferase-like domain-containing protein [Acidimicrobium ferrooxidans]ACU53190.1 peptidase S51 dipeptidase E [Acidimicrobium ferrooxidans DSM 10331]